MTDKKKQEENSPEREAHLAARVIPRGITEEMRESYLDYAMSVITARALPDVRDGLKPVHRRILYTMQQMNLTSSAKFRKSAAIIGDVMGKFHPHGDSAIYGAMAIMSQDFSYRYPLVFGQGNFGSIDGDNPAAMRYTEAKMTKITTELLNDLEKDTVEWKPNYDGTRKEPVVFPASAPNLLLNGTLGIAVGMATKIPPHNLSEIVDATVHLIDNKDATTEDLLEYIQGPDFPLGGVIYNKEDIKHAYANGRGGVVVRGTADIVENKQGQFRIIITSIPYQVNKATLLEKIADLVRNKKIEGIKDVRDESTKDIRVVIELKSGGYPQKVLNHLYKMTQLEETFHFNMVALAADGTPQTMSLKDILSAFIEHRNEVVRRRTEFDLKKAQDREHILLGLSKALDHIDEVIACIKKSKNVLIAHVNLMKLFKFSEIQATAILQMRLQKLAGLERKKIEEELKVIQKLIAELTALLKSKTKIFNLIKEELVKIKETYGDARRTKVVPGGVKNIGTEDLVPNEETVVVFTSGGYIKRTNPNEYKTQKRGGIGVVDLNTKEEDFVTTFLTTRTHADLLFFTDKGKVYQLKTYEIPEGRRSTKGKSIMNFLQLEDGEIVTSILPLQKDAKNSTGSLFMVTEHGMAKKVKAESFYEVRRNGLIALSLTGDDRLISARFVKKGDEIFLTTKKGQSIRFKESDVRQMGRTASGVRGINLGKGDVVVGANVLEEVEGSVPELLVITENGYGKRTSTDEYKTQKRGGRGIKTANITKKTGELIAARIVEKDTGEMVAISKKSQVIRVEIKEVSSLSRATQGVRVMKLREGDSIAALITL
jgi:DNA gyrase subunit A